MSKFQKIILVSLLVVGTLLQTIPTIRSGLEYSYGVGFWGPSGHDGIWHLSLINHIKNPLKIEMPIFSGSYLVNYHPFFDILLASFVYITKIPSSWWLFQIYPILSSFTLLYLSFILGKIYTNKYSGGVYLILLNTLASSFGWIISLFRNGNFGGESIFWAMQSPSNQINPPFQLSLILLTTLLIIILKNKNNNSKNLNLKESILTLLILSLLPITKAYSAVVSFSVFGMFSAFTYLKYKNPKNLYLLFTGLIFSIILFLQYNPKASSILVYQPFWFTNSMIESPDRVYIPFLANMRYAASINGGFSFKLLIAQSISLIIFIIGNFGWRLLGFIKQTKTNKLINIFLIINIFVLTLIPTLFIQKGTGWNTIQFLYYGLFLSNIFLANYMSHISNFKFGKVLVAIIFCTYILSFVGDSNNYLGKIPPANISKSEIEALKFLSQQLKGVVLTVPYDAYLKNKFPNTPIPLYAYETTSYVSAYSKQVTYLEDEMNLNNSGYDYQSRRQYSKLFFEQKNIYEDRGFLVNNNISYIYIAGKQQDLYNLNTQDMYLIKIYQNQDATIYKVQK